MGFLASVRQPTKVKKNSEFKPVALRLKIDLISRPARDEGGWVNTYVK